MARQGRQIWWRSTAAPSYPRGVFFICWFIGSVLLAFVVVPLVVLTTQASANLAEVARMADVRDSIVLSLEAAFLSATLAALIGVPLAYVLARSYFRRQGRDRRADRPAARGAAYGRRDRPAHGVRAPRRFGRAVAGGGAEILGHARWHRGGDAVRVGALHGQRRAHRFRRRRPAAGEDRAHARARALGAHFGASRCRSPAAAS